MVDVVITFPSTEETFQYRLGRATPTISQARNPRKKAKASTMAFIFPCFFCLTRVELSKVRYTQIQFKRWLSNLSPHKRVDLLSPMFQCARPFPTNAHAEMLKKTANQWLIPVPHLWFPLFFSTLLNLFKDSKCLPNSSDNREVKSNLATCSLSSIDFKLFVTFWR